MTLRDAADYIMKLPKAEQDLKEWQIAVACLIGAAATEIAHDQRAPLLLPDEGQSAEACPIASS
ncbi:MAG TPA: hypothetical protein VGA15_05085 [Bradyrhizobium sp.]